MNLRAQCLTVVALLALGILAGCSSPSTKSADVTDAVRKSLDQAGFKDVTSSQDREKGIVTVLIQNKLHDTVKYSVKNQVITFTGEVDSQAKREHAEALAASVP